MVLDISHIQHFNNSFYRNLNIDATLDYMHRRFIEPMATHFEIGSCSLADCAAGYGWLSFAYLRAGGLKAVLIEPDKQRLEAARHFAKALGVEGRCQFVCAYLQNVDIGTVDIFASVETLEHVGRNNVKSCVAAITRLAGHGILITTPNEWFPVVAHDTQLPIAHWLPHSWRSIYARSLKRDIAVHNDFLDPLDLWPLYRSGFRPQTRFQTFGRYQEFRNLYPYYLPYGSDERKRHRSKPHPGLAAFVRLAGTVSGSWSFMFSPNLISIWARKCRSQSVQG